ncbi:MAG: ROK family protein [Planctomycetales bacterium]|nr:ROK family protein [Planctomycetales bacterium]
MANHELDTTVESPSLPLFAGVDVGGTNIKIGVLDNLGRTLARTSIPTQEELGPEAAMIRASETLRGLLDQVKLDEKDVVHVGLATPGTMDRTQGILLHPHNLPNWWNYPIRNCLAQACGKSVAFANDANAAAFGEFWVGSGSEFHSIAFFTLGTGVGGGIIIGDLSVDGENSAGSEVGHTIIDYTPTARMCGCGQLGHLEAYASAKAVVARTAEALEAGVQSSLSARVKAGEELTALMVCQEADQGDDLSNQIVDETAMYLGIGAVNVMHIIDPAAVIFGGAMNFGGPESRTGQRFIEAIRQEIRSRAFPILAEKTIIEFASLGGNAGYIGAAGIARTEFRKSNKA